MKTPEDIEAEIWQHALDLAEPGGLGRLVEADAIGAGAHSGRRAARRAH